MNILILTSSYPTCEGGPHSPRFVADIAERLSQRGFSPVVLAPHFPAGKVHEFREGAWIYRFPYFIPARFERLAYGSGLLFNIRSDFFAFAAILPFCCMEFIGASFLLWRERIDLIHTHWLIPQGFIGAVIQRLFGIPHITTIHGSDLTIINRSRLLHPLCRFIARNSRVITVNSTFTRARLESLIPDSREKIRIIPMGVDPGQFLPLPNSSVQGGSEQERIILSVGRLIDWKGTRYLIEALPAVLRKIPDARLLIIGTGPEEANLRNLIRDLSLEKQVILLGGVGQDDLKRHYQRAEVFVLPSLTLGWQTEALGVVLLEAMASGCPVIASNVGGIPDIIQDGVNGFLIPERDTVTLADRITRVLSDASISRTFRTQGSIRINKHFTWDTISRQFSETYQEVLSKPQRGDLV